jgi:hypothetical protein
MAASSSARRVDKESEGPVAADVVIVGNFLEGAARVGRHTS